jgi:4-hydroxy-L-threonine phosphate dehydrogenase PdxA
MHTIGISSGDPSGIGLEVIRKALPQVAGSARWVLFTDAINFERHHVAWGMISLPMDRISQEASTPSVLYLVEVPAQLALFPGVTSRKQAHVPSLSQGWQAALRRDISDVTAPVHNRIGKASKDRRILQQARSHALHGVLYPDLRCSRTYYMVLREALTTNIAVP